MTNVSHSLKRMGIMEIQPWTNVERAGHIKIETEAEDTQWASKSACLLRVLVVVSAIEKACED